MSLRHRLFAYVISLHVLFLAFTIVLYRSETALFLTLEVLLIMSLAGGVHLLRRALEPLAYTRRFHDLLQDGDYAGRLERSEDGELGELVTMFNTMLGALYRERLAIGEQQGFLDRLLEATPSAVVVFDFDGNVSLQNASAVALLGLGQAKGRPLAHWLAPGAEFAPSTGEVDRARCVSLLAQLDALPLGESGLMSDPAGRRYRGQRGHFFDRGFARHFLLIDELTHELEDSERATHDKLIRVLAHEVNNTVAATGSVLDSLLTYASQLEARDSDDFRTAIAAVTRRNASLGEFIERFTRVVKMPAPELRPVSIRAVMDDIVFLYREQCRSHAIDLRWTECEDSASRLVDRQLLEQALLNIVKNAMEAAATSMHEQPGSAGFIHLALKGEDGALRLSITDSGRRLAEVPAQQLFAPFFTTKKGGQGIGLLFVREVMNRHGFAYRLASDSEGLTRFDIWFPAHRAA